MAKRKSSIIFISFTAIVIMVCRLAFTAIVPNVNTLEGINSSIEGKARVTFIDVGQGDSILIQTEEGAVLIDGGEHTAEKDVENELNFYGIKKLDYIVATHPHSDHIGSLSGIIEDFQVSKIIMPKAIATTTTFEKLLETIKNKKIETIQAVSGLKFSVGEAKFTALAPNSEAYNDLNNYSAVIRMDFKEVSYLFTGDAEVFSENEILTNNHNLKADILKVGHHGSSSSTSTKFLNAVDPNIAVISCGENNYYGHPHEKVMERLEKRNITIYRTDKSGDIIIETDGKNISEITDSDLGVANTITEPPKSTEIEKSEKDYSNEDNDSNEENKGKIKGNISNSGEKIYHVPGGVNYNTVVPEEVFDTEEEAIEKGYRKSKN